MMLDPKGRSLAAVRDSPAGPTVYSPGLSELLWRRRMRSTSPRRRPTSSAMASAGFPPAARASTRARSPWLSGSGGASPSSLASRPPPASRRTLRTWTRRSSSLSSFASSELSTSSARTRRPLSMPSASRIQACSRASPSAPRARCFLQGLRSRSTLSARAAPARAGRTRSSASFMSVPGGAGGSETEDLLDRAEEDIEIVETDVAHVAYAEGLLLQLPVAVRDRHAPFSELLVQRVHGDAPRVLDGRERDRLVARLREEREVLAPPAAGLLGHLQVPRKPLLPALLGDVREALVERVEERDRRGGGSLVPQVVFLVVEEVKVVAPVGNPLRALHGAVADGEDREPRGEAEALLAAGEDDIQAEVVDRDVDHGHGGHRIDGEEHVRVLLHDRSDLRQGVHDAGRGLVVDDRDDVVLPRRERRLDARGRVRLAPLDRDGVGLLAVRERDLVPALAEGAAGEVQAALPDEVPDRPFHDAGRRARAEVDVVLRAEELGGPGVYALVEVLEF